MSPNAKEVASAVMILDGPWPSGKLVPGALLLSYKLIL